MLQKPLKKRLGITITETLIATMLMMAALVPILKAMTRAHFLSRTIEQKNRSLMYAKEKLEDLKARTIYRYGTSYGSEWESLGGGYGCKITDTAESSNLRHITVSVGYDQNGNASLSSQEILVSLQTLVARRL